MTREKTRIENLVVQFTKRKFGKEIYNVGDSEGNLYLYLLQLLMKMLVLIEVWN